MNRSEAASLSRYLPTAHGEGVRLAAGDDVELAVSVDTLVSGVHFLADTDGADVGHKALAVNLSDMAAMGARPVGFSVQLATPEPDPAWMARFGDGLGALAAHHDLPLLTAHVRAGALLCVTVQIYGQVSRGKALTRSGARVGDRVYVTGTLGDAGLAFEARKNGLPLSPEHRMFAERRLNRPEPRIAEGLALGDIASAAIDVSDGLCSDLEHIARNSDVGAHIDVERLPLSKALRESLPPERALELALAFGDDYELCCTVAPGNVARLEDRRQRFASGFTPIGVIEREPGLRFVGAGGQAVGVPSGYRHF